MTLYLHISFNRLCIILLRFVFVIHTHTGVSSHMDDEYKWAGVEDPKVMVTTSRDPSSRLKMFAKVGVFAKFFTLCPHRR